MKLKENTVFKGQYVLGLLSICLIAFFSSCKKDEGPKGPAGSPNDSIAAAMVINAVPGSDGLVVALDNNQLNNLASGERFVYREYMPYKRIIPGDRLLRVFHPEKVQENTSIFRQITNFVAGKYYSLFIVGENDKTMEMVQLEDALTAPGVGKAKIRFVNASPDAPALNLGERDKPSLFAENIAYKKHTDFVEIPAGSKYDLFIANHSSKEDIHHFEFEPEEKMIYTIVAIGLLKEMDYGVHGFRQGIIKH